MHPVSIKINWGGGGGGGGRRLAWRGLELVNFYSKDPNLKRRKKFLWGGGGRVGKGGA